MPKDRLSGLRGHVRIRNEAGEYRDSSNIIVYSGGDIVTALLGGLSQYRISSVYFAFQNGGTPVAPAPARTISANTFRSLTAPQDFIKAPVLVPPTFSASDVNHVANQATFVSIASATVGSLNALPFGSGSGSQVYMLGLVASPTNAIPGDVLYAYFALPSPLPAAGSGQISAAWMVEAD